MKIAVEIKGRSYFIDPDKPLHISIPLRFGGRQPNAYGVERASSRPCEAGALVGDTRRGGSCNFEQYKFIPHCNGTHTESIGHITFERISVHDALTDAFIPATLISIKPEKAGAAGETYAVETSETDALITRKKIEEALRGRDENFFDGLIVRTLPNDEEKLGREYLETAPPFFSAEAMLFLRETGVRHLVCDLPSIDRIFDEGRLANHRAFWRVAAGSFETNEHSLVSNTITELAFVADEIKDGNYILNLQIAAFAADAAPSRPVLFKVL
jgi:kynurenine formamidase